MKAIVDKDACVGCGLCPSICPDVFEMADDGKAEAKVDAVPADKESDAKEAEAGCPVNAIALS